MPLQTGSGEGGWGCLGVILWLIAFVLLIKGLIWAIGVSF